MTRKDSEPRFSVGALVDAAYKEAGRVTRNRQLAAQIASRLVEEFLRGSDRPELIRRIQDAAS